VSTSKFNRPGRERFLETHLTPREARRLRGLVPPDFLRKELRYTANPSPTRAARWLPESICSLFGLASLQIPTILAGETVRIFRGQIHPETIAVVAQSESVVHRPGAGTIWQIDYFPVIVRSRKFRLRQLFRVVALLIQPTRLSSAQYGSEYAVPSFAPPNFSRKYALSCSHGIEGGHVPGVRQVRRPCA
jgi:hypothetical protein